MITDRSKKMLKKRKKEINEDVNGNKQRVFEEIIKHVILYK